MKVDVRGVLFLAFVLMLGLSAGCSSDDGDDNPTGPTVSAPEIGSATPAMGEIGRTTSITLRGAGLSGLTGSSPNGTLTVSVTSEDDTSAVLSIQVAGSTLPGADSVVVTNSVGSAGFAFTRKAANLSAMTWTNGPDLPTTRYGLAAVEVDGKVYVMGGADAQGTPVSNVDILDPASNTWTTGPAMPTSRLYHSSVALEGKIYVIGGGDASSVLNSFDVLDPATNTWTNLQGTPTARFGTGAGASGGKVYVVGGSDGNQLTPATESFDLTANAWTTLASMPTPRRFFGAVPVVDRVYAIGGDDTQNYLATSQFFNIENNTWSTTTAMPTARRFMGAALFLGNIVIVGGEMLSGNTAASSTTVEALNLETNTWSTVTALPQGRDTHAVVAAGGKLYVIGGGRIDGQNYSLTASTLIGQLP